MIIKKRYIKRISKSAIALVLGMTMAVLSPLNFVGKSKEVKKMKNAVDSGVLVKSAKAAETDNVEYISDLKIFSESTRAKAVQKLQSEGYKVFDQDLNEHCGGDYIYLGYKTSKNREDAITDIRQLHMGTGKESEMPYGYIDCKKVISDKRDRFNETASSIMITLKEYAENLKNGSKFAKQANKILNVYSVDDNGKNLLGDYLASDKYTTDDITTMFLEGNGDLPVTIYTCLLRAVQDTDRDNTWADRIVKSESQKYIGGVESSSGSINKDLKILDGKYLSMSEEIQGKIKEFAKSVTEAEQRIAKNDGKIDEDDENASTDALNIGNREVLNKYEFDKNAFPSNADIPKKLGDYLVYIGQEKDKNLSLSTNEGKRMLYPLCEALTAGQFEIFKVNTFCSAISYMMDTKEADKEFEDKYESIMKSLKEKLNTTYLSIYANVDRSIYNKKVCVTSAARRQDAAGKSFLAAQELKTHKEKIINEITTNLRITMEVMSIAASVAFIASMIATKVVAASASAAFLAANAGAAASAAAAAGAEAVAASAVCAWLGVAVTFFFWVGIGLLVALIIWGFISGWFADKTCDPKIERTQTLDNIYDMQLVGDEGHYIYYEGVKDGNGKTADINSGDGERWSSLFYTKDEIAGSPLCVNSNGEVFKSTTSLTNMAGYAPLRHFENRSAENIKAYSNDTDYKMYLYYPTLASLGKEENKGDYDYKKGKYLYDLMMISAEKADDAKNQLMSKGFDYIDSDLTPNDEMRTYLGYKTTNNVKNAIRDIRVAANSQQPKLYYGKYGYSGTGATNTENVIYWSKEEDAGTPILAANLKYTNEFMDKDSGWEPVNQLGGGVPFNFNARKDTKTLQNGRLQVGAAHYINGDKAIYIYFKPEKTYTSGKEYIAGIATVAGWNYEGKSPADRLKQLGYTDFGMELAPENAYGLLNAQPLRFYKEEYKSRPAKTRSEAKYGTNTWWRRYYEKYTYNGTYSIRMGYYTTYNPYRAIRDIKIKRGTPRQDTLDPSMSNGGYTYAACPVYANIGYSTVPSYFDDTAAYVDYFDSNNCISIAKKDEIIQEFTLARNNCYIGPEMFHLGYMYDYKRLTYSLSEKDKKICSYDYSYIRPQNIFVATGDDNLGEPISPDDIKLKKGEPFSISSGYENVKEFTNQYDVDGQSISLPYPGNDNNDRKLSAEIYMGIKNSEVEEKPYISEISANYYEMPDKNSEGKDLSSEERAAYEKIIDDQAIQQITGAGCGEIIMRNTFTSVGNAWYDKYSTDAGRKSATRNYDTKASYLGVRRTADKNEAITGLIRYFASNGERPGTTIKVDGVKYKRGGEALKTVDGDCYIYYTNSPFVNSGRPIEDIVIDQNIYHDDYKNVPTVESDLKKYYDDTASFIINFKSGNSDGLMHKLYIAKGDDEKDVKTQLVRKGADKIIDVDMNRGTGGEKVYIGYSTLSRSEVIDYIEDVDYMTEEELEEEWFSDPDMSKEEEEELRDYIANYRVIYDIKTVSCYKSVKPLPSFKEDGVTYKLLSDVSLNEGCSGKAVKDIYLYYTNDYINLNTDTEDATMIANSGYTALSVCSGDIVPVERLLWESVTDREGTATDVNQTVFSSNDIRLYLFARRYESAAKPENAIKEGWNQSEIPTYELYFDSYVKE